MNKIELKIISILGRISPSLEYDGGGVQFIKYSDGVVTIKLLGHCCGCPMQQMTVQLGIEEELKKEIPEIKDIEVIEDEQDSRGCEQNQDDAFWPF